MAKNNDLKETKEGQKFKKFLCEMGKHEVRIGYQAGHGTQQTEDGEIDMATVAMWNELGTRKSPSRPFLRQAATNNEKKVQAFAAEKITQAVETENFDVEGIYAAIGQAMVSAVQEEILSGNFTPNAPYTIAKKGSSNPLIDSGSMRQQVHYVIKKAGGDK